MTRNRTLIGAVIGALIAVAWITFDTGSVILLLTLTSIGGAVGATIDNPDRLIAFLQRLQDR